MNAPEQQWHLQLAEALGLEGGMIELLKHCPECNELILVPDNGVWLDSKPLPAGHDYPCPMGIMQMGTLRMAAGGDIRGGSEHRLHDHQPEDESDELLTSQEASAWADRGYDHVTPPQDQDRPVDDATGVSPVELDINGAPF